MLLQSTGYNMRYKTKRVQCYFLALFHVQSFVVADSSSLAIRFDFIPPTVTNAIIIVSIQFTSQYLLIRMGVYHLLHACYTAAVGSN